MHCVTSQRAGGDLGRAWVNRPAHLRRSVDDQGTTELESRIHAHNTSVCMHLPLDDAYAGTGTVAVFFEH